MIYSEVVRSPERACDALFAWMLAGLPPPQIGWRYAWDRMVRINKVEGNGSKWEFSSAMAISDLPAPTINSNPWISFAQPVALANQRMGAQSMPGHVFWGI